MNTQRITVSIPDYLYKELRLMVARGNISNFIAEATEEKILDKKLKLTEKDPFESFFALRKKAPKFTDRQIMNAIRKGRT